LTTAQPADSAERLSRKDLCGVFLPITTPFRSDGALDINGLAANIKQWNATGIDGFVLLGSTGERVHLDEREYLEIIQSAREAVSPGKLFIVGAGQQSTRGTVSEIKRVSETVPVDAFLVITPSFYRPSLTQNALLNHYLAVADEATAPIILYSMPALTGIRIESQTAARLSEHANIVGIKDSSADVDGLRETVKLVRDDFAVLTGNGTIFHKALRAGACGGILAVGCVAPDLCVAIFRSAASIELDRAASLQNTLTPLAEAVTVRFGLGGLKAALDMNGYVGGFVRAPLSPPDNHAIAEIKNLLKEARDALVA
jgi:4-hydroxy-2-oxoglutarate aldolase